MRFFMITVVASAAVALAMPGGNGGGGGGGGGGSSGGGGGGNGVLCHSGTFPNPECCATDVLGVADLDCTPPSPVPRNIPDFKATCAAGGKTAKCCLLPVAGQAVLCQDPL